MVAIEGKHVRLREFRTDDVDDSMAVVGDDRVTSWLSFDSLTREQQAERLAATLKRAQQQPRAEFYLAVASTTDDRLVGFARLGLTGVKAAKLGYAIAADHWGKGYATDAVRSLVDYAFAVLGLRRVTAAIGPENGRSIAVVDRLGFGYEGRLRDHVFTNGAWRDSLLYSILAPEWTAGN
jgi:RimJ/RimL family protein N-acetyltransferase